MCHRPTGSTRRRGVCEWAAQLRDPLDRKGDLTSVFAGSMYERARRQFFLLFGLCPAGVLPDANGEGAAPPFLRFLSAFGFFFSLLLRI